jgi:hypothetical protein
VRLGSVENDVGTEDRRNDKESTIQVSEVDFEKGAILF